MKAKNGATNIAVRAYLNMRLKLYRCYKVACEWCFKPFLNFKDAGRSAISELCKPLVPSTLFASACLSKKQKENSKSTKDTKTQPALNKLRDYGWQPLGRFDKARKEC